VILFFGPGFDSRRLHHFLELFKNYGLKPVLGFDEKQITLSNLFLVFNTFVVDEIFVLSFQ